MIAINVQGMLYTTRAALPHLLNSAERGPPPACSSDVDASAR
jgi:hypothetical protein